MALHIRFNVNERRIARATIVRTEPHPKLPNHFYYSYVAEDETKRFKGEVLHNYDNGAFALTQKVMKDIVSKQKEARAKS